MLIAKIAYEIGKSVIIVAALNAGWYALDKSWTKLKARKRQEMWVMTDDEGNIVNAEAEIGEDGKPKAVKLVFY